MKIMIISLAMFSMFNTSMFNKLSGVWENVSPTGAVTRIVFKTDSTFEGFVNKKPFVTGTYSLNDDDVLSFVDNGCNGVRGEYKISFYSNGDSMRFVPIADSCIERKEGMQRLNMGKRK